MQIHAYNSETINTEERTAAGSGGVLIAIEGNYCLYGEAIADVLRAMRPGAEVVLTDCERLEEEVARRRPRLVICNRKGAFRGQGVPGWVELPDKTDLPATIRVGKRLSETVNPGIGALIRVFDELEGYYPADEGFLSMAA